MPFGVKNKPQTYHKAVTKTFREYLDNFMKIFLNDFIVHQHGKSYAKVQIMFSKLQRIWD
jgi:hypothetical protein